MVIKEEENLNRRNGKEKIDKGREEGRREEEKET